MGPAERDFAFSNLVASEDLDYSPCNTLRETVVDLRLQIMRSDGAFGGPAARIALSDFGPIKLAIRPCSR